MLSSTSHSAATCLIERRYTSFLEKFQNWVRREIIDDDPFDQAAVSEGILLAELMRRDEVNSHAHYNIGPWEQSCVLKS